jgi:muramidase (phage lysozyme)
LEDLSAINYRLQGLAEKKPETQETVLVKRIKHRVRSIKEHGWALCVKVGSLEGVICRLVETHKTYLIITRKGRGYVQNRHVFSYLWTELAQAHGGPGRQRRRRLERLRARVNREIRRVDRGELNDVLTKVEGAR